MNISICTVLLFFLLFAPSLAAQDHYFTRLNGFSLMQYREVTHNEFGEPAQSGKFEDGVEYEAFALKPDMSAYMVFSYLPSQKDLIWNIQISGVDSTLDPDFRGLRLGMPASQVEKLLGKPVDKIGIDEHGTRWEYSNSNFSVEINTENMLSSIKIHDISARVPKIDVKKIPLYKDTLKALTSKSNDEVASILAPDMEVYRDGDTLFFKRPLKDEIAGDHSKIFSAIRELAEDLKSVDTSKSAEYEENMRLSLGQDPRHVMKFKKAKRAIEIVFKYQFGRFLVWEIKMRSVVPKT